LIRILNRIEQQLIRTNEILEQVEKHLYDLTLPPDLKQWSKEKKDGLQK
jgi:hypothetical protein